MDAFQQIHDYLGQNGFDCDPDDAQKSRFPDQMMRHVAAIHNECVAAGATCKTKKKAVAGYSDDIIRKGSDNEPMTQAEIAKAAAGLMKAIQRRPIRSTNGSIGHR